MSKDDRPLHYEMPHHLAEYVKAMDKNLCDTLLIGLNHLEQLGAESNDVLSALAHWASTFAAAGVALTIARIDQTMKLPIPTDELALNIFLQDVTDRVAARREP